MIKKSKGEKQNHLKKLKQKATKKVFYEGVKTGERIGYRAGIVATKDWIAIAILLTAYFMAGVYILCHVKF